MTPSIRIRGLVALAQNVRRRIGAGLGENDKTKLQQTVARCLDDVRKILAQEGAGVRYLAAPSRRAYLALSQIDWASLSASQRSADACHLGQKIAWAGLGAFRERLCARLAASPGQQEREEIGAAIERMSGQIESSVRRSDLSPQQLTSATRGLRAWFAWMSRPQNRAAYLDAVERTRGALARGRYGSALVEFAPSRLIYRLRTTAAVQRLILPTPMVRFDSEQFADLVRLIERRDGHARGRVMQHMTSDSYVALAGELEALGGIVEETRGAVHDLAQSFDRVNQRYFAGAMARPRLSWSTSLTRRKFGHYNHVRDWVMLSSTLDDARVPQLVVDFIMYHELLHKKHGLRWVNGRGHAHTHAFHADERLYEGWQEAEAHLGRLAQQHR